MKWRVKRIETKSILKDLLFSNHKMCLCQSKNEIETNIKIKHESEILINI